MNSLDKKKVIDLFNEMFNSYISEERQKEINIELDFILKDPNWSEYIFWTEDYIKEDGNIDFPKFFEKISEYSR